MTALTENIIALYSYTAIDIAQLEAALFEQLRLGYLERLRELAIQHGVRDPQPVLREPELGALVAKAREDAQSIADTYNDDLRRQVEAIAARNPNATRQECLDILSSWNRERTARKGIEIAMYTILWATNYGFDLFVTRNNLQNQLFRAVGGIPVCDDCRRIVAFGIVGYRTTQENPLPLHINCSHEWVFVNATDISASGRVVWLGDSARAA
jgi:hypothetical protein